MNAADRLYVKQRERQLEQRLTAEFELTLRAYTATLRAEHAADVAAITARIDSVHTQALRELTRRADTKGDPCPSTTPALRPPPSPPAG